MKKTLILVRHATAEDQTLGLRDFDRKLTEKGKSDARVMAQWLVKQSLTPDIFVSSPAPRAFQTAEIFAGELGVSEQSIHSDSGIYDGGPRAYLDALTTVAEEFSTLILFGHNPDITYFAEYLSGKNMGTMKKSGVAFIEFEDQKWEEISAKTGELTLYKTPKQVIEGD